MTQPITGITSTSPSTTSPAKSSRAARFWADTKYATVKVMLITSILGPIVMSGQFLYFRVIAPAQAVINAPKPVPDIIITIEPTIPPPVSTRTETETTVIPDKNDSGQIPPSQRRPGKHRAPETTVAPVPPATSSRRIAPADPMTPVPTGSSRAAPDPVTPTPSVTPVPPRTVAPSSTPIYDTLRAETMASNPTLSESVIPE